MNKLLKLILIYLFMISPSYGQENVVNVKYEYTKPYRKVKLYTIAKTLTINKPDTITYNLTYTTYYDTLKFKNEYQFILNKELEAYRINYEYGLDSVKLRYIESKELNLFDKDITIYKYLYDEVSSEDEELIIFFTPNYGIIMEKPLSWPNYVKLLSYGQQGEEEILNKLCEIILYDSHFFRDYRKK